MALVPDDGAPVLAALGGTINYTAGDASVTTNSTATFSDLSLFNGGKLVVSYNASSGTANDTLSINNIGPGAGQIGLTGSVVSYEGVNIAQVDGTLTGTNGQSLQITFNGVTNINKVNATAVQALLRAINFRTTAGAAAGDRVLNFQVTQNDGKASTLNAEAQQTIHVTAAAGNQSPIFDLTGPFTVAENSGTGTAVGTVTAHDPDAGQTLTFSETGNGTGASQFQIDANGAITVQAGANLDFETTSTYSYEVRVTDNGSPNMFTDVTVTINLSDANDAPVFGAGAITRFANAGAANGSTVAGGAVVATDPDAGGSVQSYQITSGNGTGGGAFDISTTGVLTVKDAAQVASSGSFTLQITATDNVGAVSLQKTVTVNVINNVAPVFAPNTYNFSIAENTAADTNVGTPVSATDGNAADGDFFVYSIQPAGNGTGGGAFKITAAGQIQVNDATQINFETNPTFTLTVAATDVFGAVGTATVTVDLTNVVESPTIASGQSFTIPENTAAGSVVGTIQFTFDATATPNLSFFSGNGTGTGAFAISNTGVITVADASQIDYEHVVGHVFNLSVVASDTANSLTSAPTSVPVTLTNVQEGTVLAPGDILITGVDSDGDDEISFVPLVDLAAGTEIRFTDDGWQSSTNGFRKNEGVLVYVAPAGGILAGTEIGIIKNSSTGVSIALPGTGTVFDETGGTAFTLATGGDQVIAYQGTRDVPVPLYAVNLNRDMFDADSTTAATTAVPAGLTAGTTAVALGESGTNNKDVEYTGTTIGSKAQLRTAVSDPLNWNKTNTRITLTYANFTVDPPTAINLDNSAVNEGMPVGTVVGTFTSSDPTLNDMFSYSFVIGSGDTDNGRFTIVGDKLQTGEIFDFETQGPFTIRVRTTDVRGGFYDAQFTISINDQPEGNQAPTAILFSDMTVDENEATPTVVATLDATDPDNPAAMENFTFTLVSGPGSDDNGKFQITANVLEATETFDFETKSSYTVRIRVTDTAGAPYENSYIITVNDVNEPPTFVVGPDVVDNEDTPVTRTGWATAITSGDSAPQPLEFIVIPDVPSLFSGPIVVDPNTGDLTYTPAPNANGTTSVTIRLKDDGATNNTSPDQFFFITINAVNDAPTFDLIASPDQTLTEDDVAPKTIVGFATNIMTGPTNDEIFSQSPSFEIQADHPEYFDAGPAIDNTGTLTYTLKPNAFGATVVTVTLKDTGGTAFGGVDTSAPQTFNITINGVNDAPAAINSSVTTLEDTAYTFKVADFSYFDLENDPLASITVAGFNLGGGTLKLSGVDVTANQTITAAEIPSLVFTPAQDQTATASFQFKVNDADLGTVSATMGIVITPTNDAPVATGNTVSTNEDVDYTFKISDFKFTDVDGDGLGSITITNFISGGGSLTLGGNVVSNGKVVTAAEIPTLVFSPPDDAFASPFASFDYTVTDVNGATSASAATLTINVVSANDPPTFTVPAAAPTVLEDSGAHTELGFATGITTGAANEADTLTFSTTGNTNPALFAVGPKIDEATGDLTYTLADDAFGSSDITVTLSDGNDITSHTFTITVTGVNDAPSFTVPAAAPTVLEDSGVAGAHTELAFATAISSGPGESDNLTFDTTGNTNPGLFSVAPSIDKTTGNLTYTLAANAFGSSDITVTLSDGTDTVSHTFTINVTAVNDAPTFTVPAAAPTVLEDSGAHTELGFATGITTGAANETSDTLSFSTTGNTNPGLFAVAPKIDEVTGDLTYTLADDAFGSSDITVSLSDGTNTTSHTFTITVTNVNDAPSFTIPAAAPTVLEDTGAHTELGFATGISAGPNETDNLTFNTTGNTNPGLFSVAPAINKTTGNLTYTLASNAFGSSDITVTLSDGTVSVSHTFTITVTNVNDPPSFSVPAAAPTVNEDTFAHTELGFATGISAGPNETDNLTFNTTGNTNPGLFSVAPAINKTNGNLTYTLASNAFGSSDITVTLSDGTASVSHTFTINVTGTNDPPSFTKGSDQVNNENDPAVTVVGWATNISAGTGDVGQTVDFIVQTDNDGLFSVTPAVDPSTGTLTYTLAPNANGVANVQVTLQDNLGSTSATQILKITVNSVNTPPSFNLIASPNQSVGEGSGQKTVAGFATNISAGPANENQTVTFNVTTDNDGLFIVKPTISSTGTLTFTPGPDAEGTATVTVTLTDGDSGTSTAQTFVITVNNVAPLVNVVASQTTVVPDLPITFTISASDPSSADQAAGFDYTINWGDGTAAETVNDAVGTLTKQHAYATTGTFTVTVIAKDKDGGTSIPKTVTITVGQVATQAGVLYIGGTKLADKITITAADATGKRVNVKLGSTNLGTFKPTKIVVYAAAGNDIVTTASAKIGGKIVTPNVPLRIFGGAGNDTVNVSKNRGQAVIMGNAGNDILTGSVARDIIIGNTGADTIVGGGGDDILIGGRLITEYELSLKTVDALMAVWGNLAATNTYAKRFAALTKGVATATAPKLNLATVQDDILSDKITGGPGRDLYFATLGGAVTRRDKLTGVVTTPAAAKESVVKLTPKS